MIDLKKIQFPDIYKKCIRVFQKMNLRRQEHCHSHHIIPRTTCPNLIDDKENIVVVPDVVHVILHRWLACSKMFDDVEDSLLEFINNCVNDNIIFYRNDMNLVERRLGELLDMFDETKCSIQIRSISKDGKTARCTVSSELPEVVAKEVLVNEITPRQEKRGVFLLEVSTIKKLQKCVNWLYTSEKAGRTLGFDGTDICGMLSNLHKFAEDMKRTIQ